MVGRRTILALILFGAGCILASGQNKKPMTNSDVIAMVKAGLPASVITADIKNSTTSFDTSSDALVALKSDGVPDSIILAMVSVGSPAHGSIGTDANVAPAQLNNVPASPFVLHDGTELKLVIDSTISSANAAVDDSVPFQVTEPVVVDGVTVIAKGAQAIGTVTLAKPKGHFGHGGKLNVNIDYVRLVDGSKALLRGVRDTKGGGHTGAMTGAIVATSIVFFPAAPLFLFMHGKDITIPKGTAITAFVNGETPLDRSKFGAVAK